jgi:hypothetical protein
MQDPCEKVCVGGRADATILVDPGGSWGREWTLDGNGDQYRKTSRQVTVATR